MIKDVINHLSECFSICRFAEDSLEGGHLVFDQGCEGSKYGLATVLSH